jgi:ribosomal protein S18 acetylase RimI-like enzyme
MTWLISIVTNTALFLYAGLFKVRREHDDLPEEVMRAFSALTLGLIKTFPNAEIKHEEGIDIVWSGDRIEFPGNGAFSVPGGTTIAQLERNLKYVQNQFNELNKDGRYGLFDFEASSLLANHISGDRIEEVCLKYGFTPSQDATMVRYGGLFEKIDFRDLEVRRVQTDEQIFQIFALFYPEVKTDWSHSVDFYKSLYGYVGYVDGKVVTTATAHLYEGKVFLSAVGTHPDYRNRGYGTAMSKHALQMAMEQSGSTISLLYATQMGKPIYEKIGFRQIGTAFFTKYETTKQC